MTNREWMPGRTSDALEDPWKEVLQETLGGFSETTAEDLLGILLDFFLNIHQETLKELSKSFLSSS